MSYFENNYRYISLPIAKGTPEKKGLRRAQIGAIHAIASHFTLKTEPALVVMPTGSGKTAVLMISAYLLEAKRVLIITPSRLVRNSIAIQFRELTVLEQLNVTPPDMDRPKVHEQTETITSLQDWEALRSFDVVVATPQSISPAIEAIPPPPDDLFDLILIDEAHHSPAKTWEELFNAFPKARRLLVTATPFRRDRREIKGKFVYIYPLREAYKDEIFGKIQFIPVDAKGANPDIAIAEKAEEVFKEDKEKGLHHALMVRTDSRKRANDLKDIYAEHTKLKLKTIHSDHSYGHIKKAINDLRSGELDGVICVNMMGEGFDFPNLKIAAIHSPHRSLAVTLQFIGRFARTNAGNIDTAKFLAIPAEIEIESTKLYDQDAIWQEIIIDLSRTRIDQEVFIQETIQNFQVRPGNEDEPVDVSFYTLRPYGHVKVYKVKGEVNFTNEPVLPSGFEVYTIWDYPDLNASVVIAKEIKKPKWSSGDTFLSTLYHLFVIYYDKDSHFLFINSTVKQTETYEELAKSYIDGTLKILPLNQINKVLLSLRNPAFYNVGMKNRLQSANSESYRNITGPGAQKVISESDGQLYHRGHVFGGDEDSTIGFSSSSKIWSNARFLVPDLIRWCKEIADYLTSNSEVVTHSPLDYLNVGKDVNEFPKAVIGILWDQSVFKNPPKVIYMHNGTTKEISLLDVELSINQKESGSHTIRTIAAYENAIIELDYRLDTDNWFNAVDESQLGGLIVERSHKNVTIRDYLNANLPEFFFNDFSRLHGSELFPGPGGEAPSLSEEQLLAVDWSTKKVDITKEYGDCTDGKISIHNCLTEDLKTSADIIFYDHGSGEVADFITFKQDINEAEICFYHCKGSDSDKPGQRVDDYYEVCMQVIKSLKWIENNTRLLKQIEYREKNTRSHFIKGTTPQLKSFLEDIRYYKTYYKLVIVQPGISKTDMDELSILLAATGDYIAKSRGQHLEVWCSV